MPLKDTIVVKNRDGSKQRIRSSKFDPKRHTRLDGQKSKPADTKPKTGEGDTK